MNVWIALLSHIMIVPSKDYVTRWSEYMQNSVMYPQKMEAFYLGNHLGASGLKETGKRSLNENM